MQQNTTSFSLSNQYNTVDCSIDKSDLSFTKNRHVYLSNHLVNFLHAVNFSLFKIDLSVIPVSKSLDLDQNGRWA